MRPLDQTPQAREALGVEHPLVRLLELEVVVRRDLLVIAAAILAVALLVPAAPWLLVGAIATAFLFTCGALVLRARRREQARTLILNGRERLPLPAVTGERMRLLDADHRRMLARTLRHVREAADAPRGRPCAGPVAYSSRTIAGAAAQLREVERLLQAPNAGVRGVALAHRLIVDGASPLHGCDAQRLREELRRITVLLQEPAPAVSRADGTAKS